MSRTSHAELRARAISLYGGTCSVDGCAESRTERLIVDLKPGVGWSDITTDPAPVGSRAKLRWMHRNFYPPHFRVICNRCYYDPTKNPNSHATQLQTRAQADRRRAHREAIERYGGACGGCGHNDPAELMLATAPGYNWVGVMGGRASARPFNRDLRVMALGRVVEGVIVLCDPRVRSCPRV